MNMCELEEELIILKQKLREKGLDPKNVFMYEYRKLSKEEEKKFIQAKEEARKRIKELSEIFPFAFNRHLKAKENETFLQMFGIIMQDKKGKCGFV